MAKGKETKHRKYETRCKVYDFLVEYTKKNGYAPSVREIGEAVNLKSTSSVFNHLTALKNEGKIEMKDKSPRAIKLVGYEFVKTEEWEMDKNGVEEMILAIADIVIENRQLREEVDRLQKAEKNTIRI